MAAAGRNEQTRPARAPKQERDTFCCYPLKCRLYIPQRIILFIMFHLCLQTVFTSRVVLNVTIVEIVLLITLLPTYLREILHFNVKYDGYFAEVPFAALWLTSLLLSATAKYFLKCTSEQTFNSAYGAGSHIVSAALVLGAVYVGCDRKASIALYMVSMIIKAFYYLKLPVNINALSRNYGGIMFGLCNAVRSLARIIDNYIIKTLTKNLHEWQLVFWITLGVCTVTAIVFVSISSDKRQDFDIAGEGTRLANGS